MVLRGERWSFVFRRVLPRASCPQLDRCLVPLQPGTEGTGRKKGRSLKEKVLFWNSKLSGLGFWWSPKRQYVGGKLILIQ